MSTTPQTFRIADKPYHFIAGKTWIFSVLFQQGRGFWWKLDTPTYLGKDGDSHWCHSDTRPVHDPRSPAPSDGVPSDTEMVEWLNENCTYIGGGNGGVYSFRTPLDVESGMLREAIAAAMRGGNEGK